MNLKYLIPQTLGGPARNLYNNFIDRHFGYFYGQCLGKYRVLAELIKKSKSKKIMEIGMSAGKGALMMIHAALKNFIPTEVEYYGFDLFEQPYPSDEFKNGSGGYRLDWVYQKLTKTKAKILLYTGDTKKVLPKMVGSLPKMDFVFIDGGHSEKTVRSDWKYVQMLMHEHTIVVMDDSHLEGPKAVISRIDPREFSIKIPRLLFPLNMVVIRKRKAENLHEGFTHKS